MPTTTDNIVREDLNRMFFNAWSVQRMQAGAKSQTRRIIWLPDWCLDDAVQASKNGHVWRFFPSDVPIKERQKWKERAPLYKLGETYLVAEPLYDDKSDAQLMRYEADDATMSVGNGIVSWHWEPDRLPSIFCPKWACRYAVRIEDVRVERVREIRHEDVVAEGVSVDAIRSDNFPLDEIEMMQDYRGTMHQHAFARLWEDIHGDDAWQRNPWVWVYELSPLIEID